MIIATLIIILIVAIRNIYYKKILKGFKILIIEITHYYLGLFKDITRTSIGYSSNIIAHFSSNIYEF